MIKNKQTFKAFKQQKHAGKKKKKKTISKQPKMSQHIERINAWTCYNAYAWVPFFIHTARAFRVISLEDWVLEWRFSNHGVKLAKQEMIVSIIFITSPIPGSTSYPFDCLWFPLPFPCPLGFWEPAFFNAWNLWQFGLVCPWIP